MSNRCAINIIQTQLNILIVDDTPRNLSYLTHILSKTDYKVRVATSGFQAIQSVMIHPPDLILLDIKLPDLSGYQVCEHLKTHVKTRDIPIIFLSALDDIENKKRAFQIGGADYVCKPFQAEEVLVRVEYHLRIHQLKLQLENQNQALQCEIFERELVESKYRAIFENAIEGMFQSTIGGQFMIMNPALASIFGYDSSDSFKSSIYDIAQQIYVHPQRRLELIAHLKTVGVVGQFESQVYRQDGSIIWISENVRTVCDVGGEILYFEGNIEDISKRKALEENLFREKELAQVTLKSIGDAVITTDETGLVTNLNPVAQGLIGWSLPEAQGKLITDIFNIIHETTRAPVPNPVLQALHENKIVGLAHHSVLIAKNGTEYAIDDSAAPIHDHQGNVLGAVMVFHDVTTARQLSQQLSWQATHDPLTKLLNRRALNEYLKEALATAHHQACEHVFCYLDLDRFKIVNDTCGHVAGDDLLLEIAKILKSKVRSSDILVRLGGDEFGILLFQCSIDRAILITEAIRETIQRINFCWQDRHFQIGVSIGMAAIDSNSQSLVTILSDADSACYAAKERGRNCVHVYRADDESLLRQRIEGQWVTRINPALSGNKFCLYGQKIVSTQDETGIHHYEILLRLQETDGELILPGAFIPAAERYGLMPTIDRWVIQTFFANFYSVVDDLKLRMESHDHNPIMFSINLSGDTLNDSEFVNFLQQQFDHYSVSPAQICFEITETVAIANLVQTKSIIQTIQNIGCNFSLDDFGSGMSSFSYLKNLPVNFLKIDGHFVKDMVSNSVDHAMVDCINRIGHVMGISTIAEYVEDDLTLNALRIMGVDFAQGYGINKPQPLALTQFPMNMTH